MVTLMNQLESELQELFASREDEFKNVVVKQIYKELPKGKYPKVTIDEIQNSEVASRTTTQGERTTALGYQINAFSRDMQDYIAVESVRKIMDIIDDYLQIPRYNMQRIGGLSIIPYISDPTIMMGTLRYTCVYDKDTKMIYRS